MDLAKLVADHPELVAQIETNTLTKERDRVSAHLTAGEMSGEMKTAIAACIDGTEMTQTLNTKYMMAAANKANIQNRQSESDDAGGADGANSEGDEARDKTASTKLLEMTAELAGIELGA